MTRSGVLESQIWAFWGGWGLLSLRASLAQGMDEDSVRLLHGGAVFECEASSRAGFDQERRSC